MGEPVKIVDLARNLILLSGFEPDRDIQIEFTGVRRGEKLFEELNLQAESLTPTSHSRINSLISSEDLDAKRIEASLHELQQAAGERDLRRMILVLKELVPDYTPASELLKDSIPIQTSHFRADGVQAPCRQSAGRIPIGKAALTNEPVGCAAAAQP
jgi:FlaA1/EpsC-like NDP-sugar epimerase